MCYHIWSLPPAADATAVATRWRTRSLGQPCLCALIALLERPGQLVPKNVLISRLWPDTHVEEGNLKVQIAALRRVLGDGKDGVRYIATDPGRGYRVVSPVMFADDPHPSTAAAPAAKPKCNLPSRLTRPVGRADIIDHLARWLMQRRLAHASRTRRDWKDDPRPRIGREADRHL